MAIRRYLRQNDPGTALLVTLTVITIIIAAALELHRQVSNAAMSAAATRDKFILSGMAASGVHLAMAMLIKDRKGSETDSLQEDWANADKVAEVLADFPFEDGKVALKISDELGKIQANALVDRFPGGRNFNPVQKELWDRFIRPIVSQDETANINATADIINAAKDWVDSGDDDAVTGLNGAESDYYQSLDPPYSCPNAPFSHLGELSRIKGVTPLLFHGNKEVPGMVDNMTVFGAEKSGQNIWSYKGKININTAPLPVLAALLPPENRELAQLFFDYRQEMVDGKFINDISSVTWYRSIPGFSGVPINPAVITTASQIFRIESTAELHSLKMTTVAVVQREKVSRTGKWTCTVLSWQTE